MTESNKGVLVVDWGWVEPKGRGKSRPMESRIPLDEVPDELRAQIERARRDRRSELPPELLKELSAWAKKWRLQQMAGTPLPAECDERHVSENDSNTGSTLKTAKTGGTVWAYNLFCEDMDSALTVWRCGEPSRLTPLSEKTVRQAKRLGKPLSRPNKTETRIRLAYLRAVWSTLDRLLRNPSTTPADLGIDDFVQDYERSAKFRQDHFTALAVSSENSHNLERDGDFFDDAHKSGVVWASDDNRTPRQKHDMWKILSREVNAKSRLRSKEQVAKRTITKLRPHAKRGKKVLVAASDGGRKTNRENQQKRQQYREDLLVFMRKYGRPPYGTGAVSLTAGRDRIAARFGVARRTVERNTRDLFRK